MSRVLIVDDEASICWALRESLGDEGHDVDVAASAEEGMRLADTDAFDAVVLDVRLPGMDGLTAMGGLRDRLGPVPIIVITAFGNLETAVKALEGGAFDYLVKPFDLDQAVAVIKRAIAKRRTPDSGPSPPLKEPEALIGSSPAMQELFKSIALVAPADVPILITGESGTGKELVARAIHRHSARRSGPFLPICLPALSPSLVERELFGHLKGSFTGALQDRKGLFELAAGGTILLDEIGDVAPSLQVKLLRAIEHGEVTPVGDARPRSTNIRVIAATNRPLAALIKAGEFREDLYFRLSVFPIHIPPLRERREDIEALAEHFLRQARLPGVTETQLARDVIDDLRSRPWAGNVRELRNSIERAAIVARGHPIRPEHLPPPSAITDHAAPGSDQDLQNELAAWAQRALRAEKEAADTTLYEQFLELAEPPILRTLLARCEGNRAAAAQILGIHRATLRQKLRKYRIE
jgi:DNA-binding NtrC family response regulator